MNDKCIALAKDFLREYFADGVARRPSEIEDDIVGSSRWNRTPFFLALSELIRSGEVKAWRDKDGWNYQAVTRREAVALLS